MDANAVKFLLNLLSFPNYRAPLNEIKPTPKMKAATRNKICRELGDRQLVAYSQQIKTIRISRQGRTWLKSTKLQGKLTSAELQVLQACLPARISPAETGLSADILENVVARLTQGNLLLVETEINQVWLTEAGQKFLIEDYDPSNQAGNLPFNMLADYLRLVRQFYQQSAPKIINQHFEQVKENSAQSPKPTTFSKNIPLNELDILQTIRQLDIQLGSLNNPTTNINTEIPPVTSDEDILATIYQLDQELGTDNYLPIFHLREKLQGSMSRSELDQALYRLQKNQKIKLKSLEEVLYYSPEYFEAAIPQDQGWALFFIVRTGS